ncbi:hypothetical protein NHF39_13540 [Pseudomonas proteolytica]|uniref:hypothetical protein n=1 Tax=Pseudomonas sp. MF6754 TaxID=2797529 RepID=UPI00190D9816|nr:MULTISPECIES: hypothetical protein [Pseudomonas]MBK3455163.1 hypothetical protein [Pseudomonas sp. MF6754]USW97415.1 hypothetical protein NHF39_13540 [Pseudomonas proteolytica]USW98362.1 hypothetical protein NHF41_17835 [Pseudomonas proteolytica]
MADMKLGMGWLGTIFFFIVLCLGITIFNTSLIFSGDAKTLKGSTTYTDSRMAEQKVYVDQRTLDLREEYLGIARQQATSNRYLILLTCTAKKSMSECKKAQEELDQLQRESEQQRTIQPNQQEK